MKLTKKEIDLLNSCINYNHLNKLEIEQLKNLLNYLNNNLNYIVNNFETK